MHESIRRERNAKISAWNRTSPASHLLEAARNYESCFCVKSEMKRTGRLFLENRHCRTVDDKLSTFARQNYCEFVLSYLYIHFATLISLIRRYNDSTREVSVSLDWTTVLLYRFMGDQSIPFFYFLFVLFILFCKIKNYINDRNCITNEIFTISGDRNIFREKKSTKIKVDS